MKGNLPLNETRFRFNLRTFISSLFVLFFSFSLNAQPKTALLFDGLDDRVDLPNNILATSYTKEAWIYSSLGAPSGNTNNIISGLATAFWFPADQGYKLSAGQSGFPFKDVQDPTPLSGNTWYHVAVTYDAATSTMSLYKNGVLVNQNTAVAPVTETQLHLGNYGGFAGTNFIGLMDEVRIWNIALTQTQIRDRMCTKIDAGDPLYGNLIAYYKADEGTGTNLADSKGTNDGTLVNGTTWATSGAALGDKSAYDYISATNKTASLTVTATGETFTATSSADGVQVYEVDAIPDNTTGLLGIGGNNKYFGVFQIGGTNPTYTVEYNYGTSYVGDETSYRLFTRSDNSAATWADANATQDINVNTLTVTGVSSQSGEYMLGSVGNPLPVSFTNFVVNKEKNGVKLSWSTAQEVDNSGFIVQRSADGKNWTDLRFVPAAKNTSIQKTYSFLDGNPANGLNLYRLKQLDVNGNFKFSEIRILNYLNNAGITVYPTPASSEIFVDIGKRALLNTRMKLFDVQGKEIERIMLTQLQQRISIAGLKNGIYILQFEDGTISRFVKQ
ncbi:MAG: T9SS type A sorting domain-containing protein [Flavisolibacter sp.]|nr:T9SS type A sorting domain-containing protein [Flavisolibacter sp.]